MMQVVFVSHGAPTLALDSERGELWRGWAASLEPRYSFERSATGPWLSVIAASCARMPWMPVKLAVRCTSRSIR